MPTFRCGTAGVPCFRLVRMEVRLASRDTDCLFGMSLFTSFLSSGAGGRPFVGEAALDCAADILESLSFCNFEH